MSERSCTLPRIQPWFIWALLLWNNKNTPPLPPTTWHFIMNHKLFVVFLQIWRNFVAHLKNLIYYRNPMNTVVLVLASTGYMQGTLHSTHVLGSLGTNLWVCTQPFNTQAWGQVLRTALFAVYTISLGPVIYLQSSSCHCYADDTQLYMPFPPNDPSVSPHLSSHHISTWMKTEPSVIQASQSSSLPIQSPL